MSLFLDFKLALRMLVKYPLLTIVGGAGIAFGLAAGIGGLEIRAQMINPALPLDEGDRIVGMRNWDVRGDRPGPVTEADMMGWRQLQRVEGIGTAALVEHNLDVDGTVEPIEVAEMTASAFRLARVVPRIGRPIVESDEQPGASPVAVIGYSLWQRRFHGDLAIVGRTVRLGAAPTTIVGVMPEKFGFPVSHQVWTPWRRETLRRATAATTFLIFGRLAQGITIGEAQTELTTIGPRISRESPGTHEFLRPEVVPYAHLIADPRGYSLGVALANIFLFMLMVVVSANVALLMFARAASRETEIGVRHAIGASRGRIVLQLFVEAMVLSALSAIGGLAAARYALASLWRVYEAERGRAVAFWFNDHLTLSTVAYGVGFTMLVAVIIGVLPALKVTGRDAGTRGRTAAIVDELRRQLSAESGVAAVTIADAFPGMRHPGGRFQVEGDDTPPTYGYDVRTASVDAEFFGAVGAPMLSGRGFAPSDLAGRDVAIVNASFVEHVLRGRNPVGRRVRLVPRDGQPPSGPWIEIIGVVRDLGISGTDGAGLYRPLIPDYATVRIALHTSGAPEAFGDRLRAIASNVDPTFRVNDVMPLDRVGADQWLESQYVSRLLAVLSGVALGADRWRVMSAIVRRPLAQIAIGIGIGSVLVAVIFVGMFQSAPTTFETSLMAMYATGMLGVSLSACAVPIRRALRLEPSQALRAET